MRDVVPFIKPDAGQLAAEAACRAGQVCVEVPGVGILRLPPPERLAWYAGVGLLTWLGMLDWPVALVLGVGHLLSEQERFESLRAFGVALGHA